MWSVNLSCVEKVLRENEVEKASMVIKFVIPDSMGLKMASFRDVVAFLNIEVSNGARGAGISGLSNAQGWILSVCEKLNNDKIKPQRDVLEKHLKRWRWRMKDFVGAQWKSSHTCSRLIATNALINITAAVKCLAMTPYAHYRIWGL
jgi:hypothetical protein